MTNYSKGLSVLFVVLLNIMLFQTAEGLEACRRDSSLFTTLPISEWSKAGVEGGIPEFKLANKKKYITSEDNLQKAIDEMAATGGGVLLFKPGAYIIKNTITLKSGVVLRGTIKDSVLLSVKIHGYHFSTGKPRQSALFVGGQEWVGIENLTIKYTDALFEPLDKDSLTAPWDKAVFHVPELRDTSLFVEHIWFDNAKNCWVENCNILWAGSDPIRITNSQHITCSNNFIDRSYNKCDGGMGYYNLINSSYVLIYNEYIKRIRHLAIQKNSKYNVVYHNYLEVDVNFHDGDDGYNLIEDNTINIPQWHSWHCFQRGDPKQHKVPGKCNYLYNNHARHKTGIYEFSAPGVVYEINSEWNGKKVLETNFTVPAGKTLFTVKGK